MPGGKLNRGMAVLDVLRALKGDQVNSSNTHRRHCTNFMLLLLVKTCPWWMYGQSLKVKALFAQEITLEEAQSANILGWCIEWVSERLSGKA